MINIVLFHMSNTTHANSIYIGTQRSSWQYVISLDLHLPIQSVSIATKVANSISTLARFTRYNYILYRCNIIERATKCSYY